MIVSVCDNVILLPYKIDVGQEVIGDRSINKGKNFVIDPAQLVEEWSLPKADLFAPSDYLESVLFLVYTIRRNVWIVFHCVVVEFLHLSEEIHRNMADNGEVHARPGEQNLHIDNFECCTRVQLDKPDYQGYIQLVKLIRMVRHVFDCAYGILEYATDIEMHSQSDDEFGQKQVEFANTINHLKLLISTEFDENTPNETCLENENEGASVEESSLSLLSNLVLSSIWLVHAEQGKSHEVLTKNNFIFLFCHLIEYFLFDRAFLLKVHCLICIIVISRQNI